MPETKSGKISINRLRLGVSLFILWWIPVYLTIPYLSSQLGYQNNKDAQAIMLVCILAIQTVIGILGVMLVGKELASTLQRVKPKNLPITFWRMIWSGDTNIDPTYIKTPKHKKDKVTDTNNEKTEPQEPSQPSKVDLVKMLKSKEYLRLLIIAAILGVPISAAAYFFLYFINHMQHWVYTNLPAAFGFSSTPKWWPLLPMLFAGIFVGLTIKYLPGKGGHVPADGFKAGGVTLPKELPGVIFGAIASIGLGAVVGPEAPLIALGGGLAYLAVKLIKKDVPSQTGAIVAVTGSFAAISTLFGSPLLGAFLLMEASGLGGDTATLALVPGLLGAGIGSLIFVGIDSLTGLGTQSLAIPNIPYFAHPNFKEFGYAILIGVLAAILGTIIKKLGLVTKELVAKHTIPVVIVCGLIVAVLAILYASITGNSNTDVLFSGQSALPYFITHASSFSLGAIILLIALKGIAYGLSLGSFRGGPVFPSMFIGAIIGIALSHLPGLPLVPAVAMGIGAMAVTMLRLPFTSVLLATLLLFTAGLAVMPLVIVSVVVAFVVSTRILPKTN